MPRCPICNKKVDRLYNNRCTGCISVDVRDEMRGLVDMLNAISPELTHTNGDLNEPGGFAKAFQRSESDKKMLRSLASHKGKVTLSSRAEQVYEKALKKADFSDKEKVAYMPSLKQLFKKHEPMFISGQYKFCKKSDYGKDEETGGVIVEARGGIIVYKPTEYYDENNQVVDPYADDNAIVYSEGDEEDINKFNRELGIDGSIEEDN